MAGRGDHLGDEGGEACTESKGEVVDGVFGNGFDFVLRADSAHGGPEEAGVEGGGEGLFARAVFVAAVGLVRLVALVQAFFLSLRCIVSKKSNS